MVTTQVYGMLQLLCTERSLFGAASAASIYQGSDTTGAITGQPLVGGMEADAALCGQISQASAS